MGSARGAACPPCLSCPTGSGPADNKVQNTRDVNGFTGRITTAIGSVPTDWELQVDGAGGLCARLWASLPDFVLPCWESHRGQLVRLHGTCARAGQAARAPGLRWRGDAAAQLGPNPACPPLEGLCRTDSAVDLLPTIRWNLLPTALCITPCTQHLNTRSYSFYLSCLKAPV